MMSRTSEAAQPALVFVVVDIHDLPRSDFVSTSYFLDPVWGKVELKLKGYIGSPH